MLQNRQRLFIQQVDITTLAVDAIVNAAHESLLGGGGVDGAIHLAAGPALLEFCRHLNGCETGQAKLTPGFRLPARAILHTVGPRFGEQGSGATQGDAELLANCYRSILKIAADEGFHSIAISAISCGAFGYPPEQAVPIAVQTVDQALNTMPLMERVIFCCFSAEMAQRYRAQIGKG